MNPFNYQFISRSLIFICVIIAMPMSNLLLAQNDNQYSVKLQSRTIIPSQGIELTLKDSISQLLNKEQKRHVILQFKSNPNVQTRRMLQANGTKLLDYISGNAWFAVITDNSVLDFEKSSQYRRKPFLQSIRSIIAINPSDKLSEAVFKGEIGEHARQEAGKIDVIVQCFKDISKEDAQDLLTGYGSIIEGPGMYNDYLVRITENQLSLLASEDEIQFVDQKSFPETTYNDCSRLGANINVVQGGVYNLDGTNVDVGIWDGGAVFGHNDFGTRLTISEAVALSDHATHVAGTMAGDGTSSAANGGTANQWRGVATNADVFSLTYLGGDLEPEEHEDEIQNNGIDLSQNSWGLSLGTNSSTHGNYTSRASKYDGVVTGFYGRMIPIIFAAGNNQTRVTDGFGTVIGYGSITPPGGTGKNVLTVGAINCDDNSMTNFSSWGPTDDGRLKPDVVAPGGETGANGVISTIPQNNDDDRFNNATGAFGSDGLDDFFFPYSNSNAGAGEPEVAGTTPAPQGSWEGTSMAAPVVSGVVALMLQEYRRTNFGSDASNEAPLPSTFKAVLTHTATDLGNPGPDYQFGYGLIDAQAAVDVIRDELVLQNVIGQGEEQIYSCTVPAEQPVFHVTVAWDDPAAVALAASTLVNDIDLTLESPSGVISNPWTLNPASPNLNAVTGTDNVNNVEQVLVNTPEAGTWRIHINGTNLNQPALDPRQSYSLVSDFGFISETDVSVTQVIDRTGSMGTFGYMAPAITAAQNFIELMKVGDEVGVVHFDDEDCDNVGSKANSPFNLTEIISAVTKTNASNAAVTTDRGGCTSIGAGIEEALSVDQLGGAVADNPRAMVLLTDGFENTTPFANTLYPTIPDDVRIYTVALGETADEDLMQEIATTTNGQFYNSPSVLNLLGIYYQIQGEVDGGDLAAIATGSKDSGNDTYIIPVESGIKEVTFVVGWLQSQARLELRVVDPDNQTVATGTSGSTNVPIAFHKFIKPKSGNWEIHITRRDHNPGKADYTFATLVNGGTKFYSFIPTLTEAGSCLMTEVELFDRETHQSITGASVKAFFSAPKISKFTLNHQLKSKSSNNSGGQWIARFPEIFNHYKNGKYTTTRANNSDRTTTSRLSSQQTVINQDSLNAWTTNLKAAIVKDSSLIQYDEWEVLLHDDGKNNDEVANDGIYTHCVDRSQISGSYNVRFSIEGVNNTGNRFARQKLASSYIVPSKTDPIKSMVQVYPSKVQSNGKGNLSLITIIPMDPFGNLLGPGLSSDITINSSAGTLEDDLIDNGDGYYFQKIRSNNRNESGSVKVEVEGVQLQNSPELQFRNLLAGPQISIHGGYTNPLDSFSMSYDRGLYLGFDLGYNFSPDFAIVGYFGYNKFGLKNEVGTDDLSLINLSLNGKFRKNIAGPIGISVQAGGGVYIPNEGDSQFGINAGINIDFSITPSILFEIGSDFHRMENGDSFLQNRVGLIYKF